MAAQSTDRYGSSEIGRRIARFRTKKRLTQSELAQPFKRRGQSFSHLERGKVHYSPWMLAGVAARLDVHPLEVIAGLAPETCALAEHLESLSPDRRSAAIRLFHAAQEMAAAGSEWHTKSGK
jgi:transcriptional regulator with XRE-family HTH domain